MNEDEARAKAVSTGDETSSPPDRPTDEQIVVDQQRVFVGTGVVWGLVVSILLAIFLLILTAQNTQTATVEFLSWEFSVPLIVLILAMLVIGLVLDELVGLVYRSRKRRMLRDRDQLERAHTAAERSRPSRSPGPVAPTTRPLDAPIEEHGG